MFPPDLPPARHHLWRPKPFKPPEGARAVTIAAGFTLDDGLLFCADTQHSSTINMDSTKLFWKDDYKSGARTVFAICGDVPYCRMLVQDCEEALEAISAAKFSKSGVRAELKRVFTKTFQEHIFPDPERPDAQLLMGVFCPAGNHTIMFESFRTSISVLTGYDAIGTGSDLAHYLIRANYQDLRKIG